MTPEEQRQRTTQAVVGVQRKDFQETAKRLESKPSTTYQDSRDTAHAVVQNQPSITNARKAELEKKVKTLYKEEGPSYRGEDTGREYDKFIARQHEVRGNKPFKDSMTTLETDQKAYEALRSAGHNRTSVEQAIGARSFNTQGCSDKDKQTYGTHIGTYTEHNRTVANTIQKNQQLRAKHGLQNDKRLQSTEIAGRKERIASQSNVWSPERANDARRVSGAEIYRSNRGVSEQKHPGLSEKRRDIELAKPHIDGRENNIKHSGQILAAHSPVAANHYSPKKQSEYGYATAKQAHKEQDIEPRPDNERASKTDRYVSSESYYQSKRQAYYQHNGWTQTNSSHQTHPSSHNQPPPRHPSRGR